MGSSRDYICPKCGYSAHVCGGYDYGMYAVVRTSVCLNCRCLTDIMVGVGGQEYSELSIEPIDEEAYQCTECGSRKYETWDTKKQPCPKCGAKMKADPMSESMWD